MFSLLLFCGDLTTDKNGEVTAPLPNDVIGELDGKLIIVCKMDDNETYGSVQASTSIPWTILPKENEANGRNLWSKAKNAPLVLIFAALTIIGSIWGIIIYLVFQLLKIKKLGKSTVSE